MGAPQARIQLTGDRLDLEWPAMASCTGLVAECQLRDGTVHESGRWSAVPETRQRYRTECGPLQVEIDLTLTDGCARLLAEATAKAGVDVAQVVISARAQGAATELAWVLYNGYQSWDAAGHLAA